VSRFGEEEAMSFYTDAKIKYQKVRTFLEKNHPEILERIGIFPNNVKTAWEGTPHGSRGQHQGRKRSYRKVGRNTGGHPFDPWR